MATTTPAVPALTIPLPTGTPMGKVRWKLLSTYRLPGSTLTQSTPMRGKVVFTPRLDVINSNGELEASIVAVPQVATLDETGYFELDLPADDGALAPGWDYEVQPQLQWMLADGTWVAASGTIASKFGVHVAPGDDINLDDVRPLGKIASSGQLAVQGKAGTSVVGAEQASPTSFVLLLSDGTKSAPITMPVITTDGTSVQSTPIDTTPPPAVAS